jgi:hypothetical protein
LPQAAPKLADAIMEAVGTRLQQKPGDPGRSACGDNLFEPREDALRGSRQVRARGTSIALQLQKLPRLTIVASVLGAALAMGWAVKNRRR